MFLFGLSPWIFVVSLLLFVALVTIVQMEFYGWSTFVCVGSLVFIQFLMKINIYNYIKDNPNTIVLTFVIYLSLGLIWSFIKWVSFLYKFKQCREDKLKQFYKHEDYELNRENERLAVIGKAPLTHFTTKVSEFGFLNDIIYKNKTRMSKSPSFIDYKGDIVAWVIFWIPSLIGTLLNDFVGNLVIWIVNRFSALYQKLSNKIVGDLPNEK
jgi:hypothetical protein